MFENTTVTLPLKDFDALRDGEREHRKVALALARCFNYKCTKNPEPPECKNCKSELDCDDCKIHKDSPSLTEKLTVDIERLIRVAKGYALYGKEIETDLDAIMVEAKKARAMLAPVAVSRCI